MCSSVSFFGNDHGGCDIEDFRRGLVLLNFRKYLIQLLLYDLVDALIMK